MGAIVVTVLQCFGYSFSSWVNGHLQSTCVHVHSVFRHLKNKARSGCNGVTHPCYWVHGQGFDGPTL